jgi:putative phosphoserine phosphatase/1-acylglycerol-3-phosphate O-acyltransferase
VRVGPPVEIKGRRADADTRRIMTAISELLPDESRRHHVPTADELQRSKPPA